MNTIKNILDIGEIQAPFVVFGGAYSNIEAAQKFKDIVQKKNISPLQILCTGDSIGYFANPEETIQFIKEWGVHSIAGNVELQLRLDKETCGCNFEKGSTCDSLSNIWYSFAQSRISKNSKDFLHLLPHYIRFSVYGKKGMVVHGSYSNISEFIFESTSWEKKEQEAKKAEVDIIIAGHSGIPFSQQKNGKMWINSGSIGMPANDGTPRVWYSIVDIKNDQIIVEHCSFEYDAQKAQEKMKKHGLPQQYSTTLTTGLWDNCDILPVEETQKRGIKICI